MKITGERKVIAVAIVVAALLACWVLWPSGVSYQGRSIQNWFYHPGEGDTDAFRAMGSRAVPFLIQRLQDAPSERAKSLLASISRTSKEIYRQRKEMWQQRAAYLLGEIGTVAQAAETNLTGAAASGNWSLRGAATVALMKMRHESPDLLIEKLRNTSDWQAWYENAMMVGQFGAHAEPAVPVLLQALQHTNNIIQAHALIALGKIAKRPDQCVPAIAPFLASPSIAFRQKAMGALLAFGTNALPAKSAIQGVLGDSDPWVKSRAQTLMKILTPVASEKRAGSAEPVSRAPQ